MIFKKWEELQFEFRELCLIFFDINNMRLLRSKNIREVERKRKECY